MKRAILIYALALSTAMAQSTVTGSKTMQGSWDASGATATKPAKSGASLPATCNTGEFFFNTAAAAGQNLYLCAPANTWTQVTSSGGGSSPSSQAIVFDGSTTNLADGSIITWSACSTNAMCATWTVPTGVSWVSVESWSGGGPGLGATNGYGGSGGAGSGFGRRACPVTAGGTVTVQVGLGGIGGTGYGGTVTPGGNSSFGTCIGAIAGSILNNYANGNPPGVAQVNGIAAPPGPYLQNNGYYNNLAVIGGSTGAGTPGFVAVREDQGGWPGSGSFGSIGAGNAAGAGLGGGGGGGGGAAQNATGGAAGTSLYGGAGGVGGGSGSACTNGSVPGGGGGGAYVPATGITSGCNGARGEVRVYYGH